MIHNTYIYKQQKSILLMMKIELFSKINPSNYFFKQIENFDKNSDIIQTTFERRGGLQNANNCMQILLLLLDKWFVLQYLSALVDDGICIFKY